jgi:O-antigen biosynthesis protein WbqV
LPPIAPAALEALEAAALVGDEFGVRTQLFALVESLRTLPADQTGSGRTLAGKTAAARTQV